MTTRPRAVVTMPARATYLLGTAVVCWALAVTACGRADSPATPPAVESLLLPIEDVRHIADLDDLSADGAPVLSDPQPDPTAPGPCKSVLDQQFIFGNEVTDFRTASYGAPTHTGPGEIRGVAIVTQAVGVYPDDAGARSAFESLDPALAECSALHAKNYEYHVTAPDTSTLTLHSGVADIVNHVQGAVLIHITVVGLPDSGRIAQEVTEQITERLR